MSDEIKTLDMDTARMHGITCVGEILDTVCHDCSKRNPFCEIRARYGVTGEHPSIVYREDPFGFGCYRYTRLTDKECGRALKHVLDAIIAADKVGNEQMEVSE